MKIFSQSRISGWLVWSLLFSAGAAAGEFDLKLSPEAGYFGRAGDVDTRRDFGLMTGFVTAGYRFRQTRQHGQIQIRFRPEQYGVHAATTVVNINGNAEYSRQWNTTQWGLSLQQRRMNFYRPGGRLFADITQVALNGQWQDAGPWSTEIQLAYFARHLSGDTRHALTTPVAVFRARYRKNENSSFSFGFYTESFKLSVPHRPATPRVNRGWGIGPELNFEYRGSQIVSFSYLAVFRKSDNIDDKGHEHRVSLLLGRTFGDRYSLFLFADYTFRQLSDHKNAVRDLYYYSSNNESRFYLKFGYDLTKSLEAFMKAGYVRYELYGDNSDFFGSHVTLGISAEL